MHGYTGSDRNTKNIGDEGVLNAMNVDLSKHFGVTIFIRMVDGSDFVGELHRHSDGSIWFHPDTDNGDEGVVFPKFLRGDGHPMKMCSALGHDRPSDKALAKVRSMVRLDIGSIEEKDFTSHILWSLGGYDAGWTDEVRNVYYSDAELLRLADEWNYEDEMARRKAERSERRRRANAAGKAGQGKQSSAGN